MKGGLVVLLLSPLGSVLGSPAIGSGRWWWGSGSVSDVIVSVGVFVV